MEYWVKAQEGMSRGKSRVGRGGGRGGRRGGRGGRHGNQWDSRKRRRKSKDGEGSVAKQPKQDGGEEGGDVGKARDSGEAMAEETKAQE